MADVNMRDEKGRFKKGFSSSPSTQFKKGQHWRKAQLFRDKTWLMQNYVILQRSASDIANEFGVTESAVLFWLKKHDIPRRTVKEARKLKHWGLEGSDNPMWNKRGELNPRWRGGITQERQAFYQSDEWKKACQIVWKRDKASCQRCGIHKKTHPDIPFHIHHFISFSDKELRAEPSNLVLLCEICHCFVHSRRNKGYEFISEK